MKRKHSTEFAAKLQASHQAVEQCCRELDLQICSLLTAKVQPDGEHTAAETLSKIEAAADGVIRAAKVTCHLYKMACRAMRVESSKVDELLSASSDEEAARIYKRDARVKKEQL